MFASLADQIDTTKDIARKLNAELDSEAGFLAMPYNGKMNANERNQAQVRTYIPRRKRSPQAGIFLPPKGKLT